jgi:hypothetical protein
MKRCIAKRRFAEVTVVFTSKMRPRSVPNVHHSAKANSGEPLVTEMTMRR